MRIAVLKENKRETAALLHQGGLFPLSVLPGGPWPGDLLELLQEGRLDALHQWYRNEGPGHLARFEDRAVPFAEARLGPLYRRPRKIWGIGLNYREHAADLSEKSPSAEPASFMKPDTAIIGHGDVIHIPVMSEKTTGEAELGLVFKSECKEVPRGEWQSVLAGYTAVIDMTAEDILRRNPRNLTQSKSFDTFFSFGPVFVTMDEIADVMKLTVRTVHNGRVHAENTVSNMTFPPDYLVWYHTRIMTMLPGDIISSGTPGAAPLSDGDTVECRIDGFEPLVNTVRDLKKTY